MNPVLRLIARKIEMMSNVLTVVVNYVKVT